MANKKGCLDDLESIVIETDEENPVIIAELTQEEIRALKGYRVRLRPKD